MSENVAADIQTGEDEKSINNFQATAIGKIKYQKQIQPWSQAILLFSFHTLRLKSLRNKPGFFPFLFFFCHINHINNEIRHYFQFRILDSQMNGSKSI